MDATATEAAVKAAGATRYFDATGNITREGALRQHGFINGYTIANGLSYTLVSTSFVALYAIAYGAEERFSGALSGVVSLSMGAGVFSLFLLTLFGASRLMGYAWSTRYVFAVGLLFAPWVAAQPQFGPSGALALIFICMLGFSTARAIGASAWLPLIHAMTTQENRMNFMAGNSLRFRIGATAGLLGAVAYLRQTGDSAGQSDPANLWWILLAGVGVGLLATTCLFLLPRPTPTAQRIPTLAELRRIARGLWHPVAMRCFFLAALLLMVASGLFQAQRLYYLVKVLGFNSSEIVWIEAAAMLSAGLLMFPLRTLATRLGEMEMLRLTLLAQILVGVVFTALPANPYLIGLATVVWNTAYLWMYLSVDRTMLGECDAKAITVVPVIWTSAKECVFGLGAMASGFLVNVLGRNRPASALRECYTMYDNAVMLGMLAVVLFLYWSLRRYPLSAAAARLGNSQPVAAPK